MIKEGALETKLDIMQIVNNEMVAKEEKKFLCFCKFIATCIIDFNFVKWFLTRENHDKCMRRNSGSEKLFYSPRVRTSWYLNDLLFEPRLVDF
jgi:hypothetical protein